MKNKSVISQISIYKFTRKYENDVSPLREEYFISILEI